MEQINGVKASLHPERGDASDFQSATKAMFIAAEKARKELGPVEHHVTTRLMGNPKNQSSDSLKFAGDVPFDNEKERFQTDAAAEEKVRRDLERAKRAERDAFKREFTMERDKEHWSALNAEYQKEQSMQEWKRANSHKEDSGVGYNPVTTDYRHNANGKTLQEQDRQAKERVQERSNFLYVMNNSYNPITGKDIRSQPESIRVRSQLFKK